MAQTMEQQRAADAWSRSEGCTDEYMKLAKGLPALIMNSGLMQTMAFLHEKGDKASQRHCRDLATHLRDWLHRRFPAVRGDFGGFMEDLMKTDPRTYQAITTESFAWLRWLRQMSAARQAGG
jgi:CRISPR-associated protein Cmr5